MNKFRITNSEGIDEKLYIPINDQNQYIFLRGQNITNPVILYLHGGPAGPDSFLTYEFVNTLCDRYTFVMWDQRGCGRTYYENRKIDKDNKTATFEQAVLDVNELVLYLRERFHKDKIIIFGHSYGTVLGVNYVLRHPELVERYIGVGQSVSIMGTQEKNYVEVLASMKAKQEDTTELTKAFEQLQRLQNMNSLMKFNCQVIRFYSKEDANIKRRNLYKLVLQSPDISWRDIKWMLGMLNMKKHIRRNRLLFDYTLKSQIMGSVNRFFVPMIFIIGEYDRNCNVELLKEYFDEVKAPQKKLIIMENCEHSPHVNATAQFAEIVKHSFLYDK